MPNTERTQNGTAITPVEARRIVRAARQAATAAYTLKRRRRGWFTSLGAAVHYTLLEAVQDAARKKDLRKRVMTPRAILRQLLSDERFNPQKDVPTTEQIIYTFSHPTKELDVHQFSIVPAAHVPLSEEIETITEAELTEWYTRIRRTNFWKEGALLIHTFDYVLVLRYALLHHQFRLTGRGGAPLRRGQRPLKDEDKDLHASFRAYLSSIPALKPKPKDTEGA
jgi:hypothetical protein